MEQGVKQTDAENICGLFVNDNSKQSGQIEQISTRLDKKELSDNQSNSNMKEGYTLQEGDTANVVNKMNPMNGVDGSDPNINMSMSFDNSKEESDLSDYGEDNTTCQLANHALRAKLLSSAVNPSTGINSKLRVSVFDHRINGLPNKFIHNRRRETGGSRDSVDSLDNLNENSVNKQTNGVNFNEVDTNNKRKASSLSYPVLRANRRSESDQSCTGTMSRTNSKTKDRNSDFRTQFDVLLRSLIGDVDEIQVEPAPNTVSSGYESDYTQMRCNKDNNTSSLNKYNGSSSQNKENRPENLPIDYFSMSDNTQGSPITESQRFMSLPSLRSYAPEEAPAKMNICESKDLPITRTSALDRDSQAFSYTQRHNYKLTKVTRNMYEIIHDLQNGEKATIDSKKRSRKGRRSGTDGTSGSDGGNPSAKEIKPRGRIQSSNYYVDNKSDSSVFNRNIDTNGSSVSGSVVRCVRRPLCNETSFRPLQRMVSHSESCGKLEPVCDNNNCDKVQNDLRNLLCGSSDVTLPSGDNNDRLDDFNVLHSSSISQDRLSAPMNDHTENGFNQSNGSINRVSDLSSGHTQRMSTLLEQFSKRTKPDDHVYETIPGDEKLYEEWKKLRATSKMPRIRRFTTVPDLPGTFVPKEPPALPERRYLSNNQPQPQSNRDSGSSYIFMGDINSNFPPKDSGYASVASDNMLESRPFMCYPYPLQDDSTFNQPGRNDETSDGYCSIDNLSLLRESVTETSFPDMASIDWRVPNTNSIPRLPKKRPDVFSKGSNKRNFNGFNGFNHKQSTFKTDSARAVVEHVDRRLTHRSDSDSTLVSSSLERDVGKQVFQATYV